MIPPKCFILCFFFDKGRRGGVMRHGSLRYVIYMHIILVNVLFLFKGDGERKREKRRGLFSFDFFFL